MTHIATKTKTKLSIILITMFVLSGFFLLSTMPICEADTVYVYNIYGPIDESTGLTLAENVTVIFHYSTHTPATETGIITDGYGSVDTYKVDYLEFIFEDNTTRQYWIDTTEISGPQITVYAFKSANATLTDYTVNFLDYTGVMQTYPFVTTKVLVNGTYFTVEKRVADSQNIVSLSLIQGNKYQITVGNALSNHIYGDLLATSSTTIQLILRGVDFPKETLLKYPYVTFYGYREFGNPFGSIVINYNDTKTDTTSFTANIRTQDGTVVYTYTVASTNTIAINWTSAVNATIYTVDVSVVHGQYGDISWSQNFANQAGDNTELFSFSFLGDWAFNTAYILPALIILFVACCFSVLNAEVGAILATIAGLVLAYIGWLPIPVGLLVSAFAFSILMAIVYNKRRGAVY